ncbi:hypothetical protein Kpol_1064p20 [Vanderwaltozyma polyspora DSM 70294]|uniref:KOW domain-containing protein n=1 Tax=Vanderwaltozyma polyspora (strain ATCC 22028 / DSM 70294 / BCRC 21397 / CBS 2163 / NBRC 10782 / NRRL Y-8283 / UCD 57-17) TaxID=436907 RepID=A7TME5_VANPO|nr:uncharacterized protein Kpol_1064p20 [Vanderwaltozyma polyspora DSM 70294]EDO16539.1 hypothetical protein Kpol_1064p20 [Vanderwaltozyma polyspora DSM 70294]
MEGAYLHLTKVRAKLARTLENQPRRLRPMYEKFGRKTTPLFLQSEKSQVLESERFTKPRDWKYLPGDRVVLLKGSKAGNICVIKSLREGTNSFILDENGPTRMVALPKPFWTEGQTSHMIQMPLDVDHSEIRLVADIDDPAKDGSLKTVAVKDVVFGGSYYDEDYKKVMPYRYVNGDRSMVIPWPRPAPVEEECELGTDPVVAREQTFWVDSIVKNPIPKESLLTIRNPYSKHRRGTLTAKEIAHLMAPKMPLTETKKAYLAERKKLAKVRAERPVLSDEEKDKIGAKIFEKFVNQ